MQFFESLFNKGKDGEDGTLPDLPSETVSTPALTPLLDEEPPAASSVLAQGHRSSSSEASLGRLSPRSKRGNSSAAVRRQPSAVPMIPHRKPCSHPSQQCGGAQRLDNAYRPVQQHSFNSVGAAADSMSVLDRAALSTLGRDAASMRLEHCNALRRM